MKHTILSCALLGLFLMCNAFSCGKDDEAQPGNNNGTSAKLDAAKLTQNGGQWSLYALHWTYYKADGSPDRTSGNDKYDRNYTWRSEWATVMTFSGNGQYQYDNDAIIGDILPNASGAWAVRENGAKLELPTVVNSGIQNAAWTVLEFTDHKMRLELKGKTSNNQDQAVMLGFER